MAQNITLMGASYSAVPAVTLPKTGGGTASFTDVSDTTATAADVASGTYFYTAGGVRTEGTASGGGGSAWTDVSSLISYSSAFASTVFAIKSNSYFVALIDYDGENSSDTEFYISLPFQLDLYRYSDPGVDIVGILQTAEAPYDPFDYAYYYDATTIMCSVSAQENMTALICAKLN